MRQSEFKHVVPPRADETILLDGQTRHLPVKWWRQVLLVLLSCLYENDRDRDRDRDRDCDHGCDGDCCVRTDGHLHQTEVWEEKGFCFALSVL